MDNPSSKLKLDASGDAGHVALHRLTTMFDVPDYVKHAEASETLNPENLPSERFADAIGRQFPIHTKAACFISTMFFAENRHGMPPARADYVQRRLEKAAAEHGIYQDFNNFLSAHEASTTPQPLSNDYFALVKKSADGSVERNYPLRNAREVKMAAEWFAKYRDEFHFEDRYQIANRILDKAASYGAGIPDEQDAILQKHAGRGVYSPKEAVALIGSRLSIKNIVPELKEGLLKLATQLEHKPELAEDLATTIKLAGLLDNVDRMYNRSGKYSNSYPRPEDVLFAGVLKYAEAFVTSACPTLTGAIYDKEQFSKLSLETVREPFGDEIAQEVSFGFGVNTAKMAEVASTFPLPDAIQLDRVMQSIGELPAHVKAGSLKLDDTEKQALAADYRKQSTATT